MKQIDRQRVRIQGVRHADHQMAKMMALRVETAKEVRGRGGIRIGFMEELCPRLLNDPSNLLIFCFRLRSCCV